MSRHTTFKFAGQFLRISSVGVILLGARAVLATPEVQVEIDPDEFEVSATSYYQTFGQVPSKMADNSGLSSPIFTGDPIPASDSLYPTHDTVLTNMYRSGKDTHPDLFFSLGNVFDVSALHYWNFNGDNKDSHPSGGDKETTDDGINQVEIDTSTSGLLGPWTPVGTYTLAQAPNLATYTGQTLDLGKTITTQFIRFHVLSNFSPTGVDQSSYFGMSELRFIGAELQWNVNTDGNWSDANNWQGPVPNAIDGVANFLGAINQDVTVTADTPVTVGTINFDQSHQYTIAGSNTITFASTAGPTISPAINVINGSHTILAPLATNQGLAVTVADPDNSLTIASDVSFNGTGLSKAGSGTLVMKNVRGGSIIINAGTVRIMPQPTPNAPSGVSVVKNVFLPSPFFSSNAVLDLTNNSMIVDYPDGTVGPVPLRLYLNSHEIISSLADASHRLGYADNTTLHLSSFGGQSVDDSSQLVKYTFAGDANLDGQVDVTDLGALATNWQSTLGVWSGGDFNYDGIVDVTDLGLLATNWQAGVGAPLGVSFQQALAEVGLGGVTVPEPVSLGLMILLAAPLLRRRSRLS